MTRKKYNFPRDEAPRTVNVTVRVRGRVRPIPLHNKTRSPDFTQGAMLPPQSPSVVGMSPRKVKSSAAVRCLTPASFALAAPWSAPDARRATDSQ